MYLEVGGEQPVLAPLNNQAYIVEHLYESYA